VKLPSLSLNGTSARPLFDSYTEARTSLRKSIALLQETWPHARDYSSEDWPVAVAEHEDRLRRLLTVCLELGDLAEHSYTGIKR